MSPTPIDQRTIDPELKAEIDAVYADIERQQTSVPEVVVAHSNRPFMRTFRTDAVVELTEQAKEQSKKPDANHEAQLQQVRLYTQYINDLRDRKLGNQ